MKVKGRIKKKKKEIIDHDIFVYFKMHFFKNKYDLMKQTHSDTNLLYNILYFMIHI